MPNVIITNTGQNLLIDALTNNSYIYFKYFKVSDIDYTLDPTITDITGWIQKDITSWIVIDNNTIVLSCKVLANEAISTCNTIGIYDINDNLIFLAKPEVPYPPNTQQQIDLQILVTNIGQISDFSYIDWNDQDTILLLTQILSQTSNEFNNIYYKLADIKISIDDLNDIVSQLSNGTLIDALKLQGYVPDKDIATPDTIPVRTNTGTIIVGQAINENDAISISQADKRYINVDGDEGNGTFSFNGSLFYNNSEVVTFSDLQYTSYVDVNILSSSTNIYNLTLPEVGVWFIAVGGPTNCSTTQTSVKLLIDGIIETEVQLQNTPLSDIPTIITGIYSTTNPNQTITIETECMNISYIKAVKIYPPYKG